MFLVSDHFLLLAYACTGTNQNIQENANNNNNNNGDYGIRIVGNPSMVTYCEGLRLRLSICSIMFAEHSIAMFLVYFYVRFCIAAYFLHTSSHHSIDLWDRAKQLLSTFPLPIEHNGTPQPKHI
jgi:hypothetical protein